MGRWLTWDQAYLLPRVAACYAVYFDGELVYVGQTEDLHDRFKCGHQIRQARYSNGMHTPWGYVGRFELKYRPTVKYGDWAMVELRMIRRLQPPLNRRGIDKREAVA